MSKSDFLRIVKFGIVGGSGVFVNMGVLNLLSFTSLPLEIRSPMAIFTALTTNFLLNHFWTWRDKKISLKREFALRYSKFFVSSGGTAFLFNYLPLLYMVHKLNWNENLSNFLGIGVAAVANYFISHFWTFRHKNSVTLFMDLTEEGALFFMDSETTCLKFDKSSTPKSAALPETAQRIHKHLHTVLPEEIRQGDDGTIALKMGAKFVTFYDQIEIEGETMETSAVYDGREEDFLAWWENAQVLKSKS